ncbi:MAG: PQQ-binding-like beta-propeller repeat protein, partial [Verrucomicrobiota bacterium]
WPMFRGDPTLRGVSPASLPDRLARRWTHPTGQPVSSSAAIVDGRVYIGSGNSNLLCLNLTNGQPVWSFVAGGPIEASPLVLDGRVYVGDIQTNFYCLDAARGSVLWARGFDDKVKSSASWAPGPLPGRKQVIVGNYDFRLYSFDAESGRTNWVYETGNYINGSPAIGDGLTAFGGCDAIVHVVSVTNGTKVREIDAGAYIAASAAVVDQRAYVGHYENEFLCVDLAGGRVAWRYKDRAFPFMSSPAVTTDRVVVGSHDKRLHCLRRDTGEAVWTFATRGKVQSSPVVAGDKVLVGSDDGRLYLVALADGRELWSYEIGQPVGSSPAVVDGWVVVGSEDGQVYAFGPAP